MHTVIAAEALFFVLAFAKGAGIMLGYDILRCPARLEMLSLFSFNTSNTPLPTVPYPKIATLIIFFYSLPNIFR